MALKPLPTPPSPGVLGPIDTGRMVIGGLTPANGRATLTLQRDGTCRFAGSFTNDGPFLLDVAVVIVVHSSTGHDHPFSRGVRVNGSGDGGSTTASWDVTSHEPGIAADWPALVAGGSFDADASASLDVPALLARLLRAIVGAAVLLVVIGASLSTACGRAPHVRGACLPGGYLPDGTTPCPTATAAADGGAG